jgi:hypothetical protein
MILQHGEDLFKSQQLLDYERVHLTETLVICSNAITNKEEQIQFIVSKVIEPVFSNWTSLETTTILLDVGAFAANIFSQDPKADFSRVKYHILFINLH